MNLLQRRFPVVYSPFPSLLKAVPWLVGSCYAFAYVERVRSIHPAVDLGHGTSLPLLLILFTIQCKSKVQAYKELCSYLSDRKAQGASPETAAASRGLVQTAYNLARQLYIWQIGGLLITWLEVIPFVMLLVRRHISSMLDACNEAPEVCMHEGLPRRQLEQAASIWPWREHVVVAGLVFWSVPKLWDAVRPAAAMVQRSLFRRQSNGDGDNNDGERSGQGSAPWLNAAGVLLPLCSYSVPQLAWTLAPSAALQDMYVSVIRFTLAVMNLVGRASLHDSTVPFSFILATIGLYHWFCLRSWRRQKQATRGPMPTPLSSCAALARALALSLLVFMSTHWAHVLLYSPPAWPDETQVLLWQAVNDPPKIVPRGLLLPPGHHGPELFKSNSSVPAQMACSKAMIRDPSTPVFIDVGQDAAQLLKSIDMCNYAATVFPMGWRRVRDAGLGVAKKVMHLYHQTHRGLLQQRMTLTRVSKIDQYYAWELVIWMLSSVPEDATPWDWSLIQAHTFRMYRMLQRTLPYRNACVALINDLREKDALHALTNLQTDWLRAECAALTTLNISRPAEIITRPVPAAKFTLIMLKQVQWGGVFLRGWCLMVWVVLAGMYYWLSVAIRPVSPGRSAKPARKARAPPVQQQQQQQHRSRGRGQQQHTPARQQAAAAQQQQARSRSRGEEGTRSGPQGSATEGGSSHTHSFISGSSSSTGSGGRSGGGGVVRAMSDPSTSQAAGEHVGSTGIRGSTSPAMSGSRGLSHLLSGWRAASAGLQQSHAPVAQRAASAPQQQFLQQTANTRRRQGGGSSSNVSGSSSASHGTPNSGATSNTYDHATTMGSLASTASGGRAGEWRGRSGASDAGNTPVSAVSGFAAQLEAWASGLEAALLEEAEVAVQAVQPSGSTPASAASQGGVPLLQGRRSAPVLWQGGITSSSSAPTTAIQNTGGADKGTVLDQVGPGSAAGGLMEGPGAAASLCVICLDAPMEAALAHGDSIHVCVCRTCSQLLQEGDPCPMCREPVEKIYKRLYM
mmetsp:Transcript_2314/g.5167  ORF Transcript_2314/g.5167 Transcript_2314/m.5167 type:complete len:1020 (-) Transcript_2314:1623-4682(-)|eukprot:CAMPEP_0202894270 /NCGR_PEP_ID=MMETSP1392-20130828/3706_1 /ASSEMBLY_ACC=CAM_ASM_000868 /TAXON_ID=225041 /ORGANISM="Chlamydomonas chlamydogama, Strain SAG 11-48b" /LENGTH=1019 /DNA_ID=CAMNT_0049578915 /DNA_START=136 /DNA_END=3195 /DNA_ORIENTATION=+